MKRTRELKPLSSEHHQALLVAFQLRKGLAGHGEAAGAPRDLPGLLSLARRFEETTLRSHFAAEEELLGRHLAPADMKRLKSEHAELSRLLDVARSARPAEQRQALTVFAELLERHIRWEERELFPGCEEGLDPSALSHVGHELEKRLVTRGERLAKRT
jgi:hemerythrin-like domain-containing protein